MSVIVIKYILITEYEVCTGKYLPEVFQCRKDRARVNIFSGEIDQTRLLGYLLHGVSFKSVKEVKREEREREIGPITSLSCMGNYWTDSRSISVLDLVIGPRNLTCHVVIVLNFPCYRCHTVKIHTLAGNTVNEKFYWTRRLKLSCSLFGQQECVFVNKTRTESL